MNGALVLASSSPRRCELLSAAGFEAISIRPTVDDGSLMVRAARAAEDCCALAWFKGAQVADDSAQLLRCAPRARVVLAADTVCVLDGVVLGKPSDVDEARRMLTASRNRTQRVVTGVCIIILPDRTRTMFADMVEVRFGEISDAQLESHLASDSWRGRAGGYNLAEIVAAGWSVKWAGDQTTVVGLPMNLLKPILTRMVGCRVPTS